MTTTARIRPRRFRAVEALLLTACLVLASPVPSARGDAGGANPPSADDGAVSMQDWQWPVQPFRLARPFVAPPHEYGPGHRGVDLAVVRDDGVRSPAAGVVAFSGHVAGRGVLTIDHGDGLVSTLEPVDTDLEAGMPVAPGTSVGRVSTGGHAPPGTVHFGVRLDGEYINPLVLLGGVPRAVLLPCC